MTSGKKSDIAGIIPPNQFPRAVWKELAARKQLKTWAAGSTPSPSTSTTVTLRHSAARAATN